MVQKKKASIIFALSSKNNDKAEYLTGEDLGLKPSTGEQARLEYSPLGKSFNKELDKDYKKENLYKRIKNIEDKSGEKLHVINDLEEKPINQFRNTGKNKTRKAIDEISNKKIKKKMMKQINYCLNLEKQMRQLIMQDSFVQKLMELNMTLIVFLFH